MKQVNDRNYYRMLEDEELIELSKSVRSSELSIVLGERLKRALRKLEAGYYENRFGHYLEEAGN